MIYTANVIYMYKLYMITNSIMTDVTVLLLEFIKVNCETVDNRKNQGYRYIQYSPQAFILKYTNIDIQNTSYIAK